MSEIKVMRQYRTFFSQFAEIEIRVIKPRFFSNLQSPRKKTKYVYKIDPLGASKAGQVEGQGEAGKKGGGNVAATITSRVDRLLAEPPALGRLADGGGAPTRSA